MRGPLRSSFSLYENIYSYNVRFEGGIDMKLTMVVCVTNNEFADAMLKKNILNDYVLNNTFMDVTFHEISNNNERSNAIKFIYRRLWETVCLRHPKEQYSFNINQGDEAYRHIKISLAEAFNFLDKCIPPVIRKGRKTVEMFDSVEEVAALIESMLTDPITKETNMSYFENVCQLKEFNWNSSCNTKRLDLIKKLMTNKKLPDPRIFGDQIIGNIGENTEDEKTGIVTYSSKLKDILVINQFLSILNNTSVTDICISNATSISISNPTSDVMVTCFINGKISYEQFTTVLGTDAIINMK